MKRSNLVLATIAMLTACVGEVALAQSARFGQSGGFLMGNNLLGLVRIDSVQKEIEIVDDQLAEINKLAKEIRSGREGQQRPVFRNMSDEEQKKAFAEMRERTEKEAKIANAKLAKILLPHQIKRAKEISVQVRGTLARLDSEVAAELKLKDAQKQKMEDVMRKNLDSIRARLRELLQTGNRDGIREKIQEMRVEAEQKVLAVLTADRKAKLDELKGEPFEMPERSFGRGGFGDRRRQGGQGRPQRPATDN